MQSDFGVLESASEAFGTPVLGAVDASVLASSVVVAAVAAAAAVDNVDFVVVVGARGSVLVGRGPIVPDSGGTTYPRLESCGCDCCFPSR